MMVGANILVIFWILFCWTVLSLDSRSEIEWGAIMGDEDSKTDDSGSNPRDKRMH